MTTDRKPGRPRDARVDAAVAEATRAVLAEHGFGGATVEAIAARAGVGKATIYRRWPSREALLLGVMSAEVPALECPDTGSLREDLVAVFGDLAEQVATAGPASYLSDIIGEAARNPAMAESFQRLITARRSVCGVAVQRAADRGDLRDDVDVDLVIDLVSGAIFYRKLFALSTSDRAHVGRIVDAVLFGVLRDGVGAAPAGARRRPARSRAPRVG
jgi:AcrR family transcriptional regulator